MRTVPPADDLSPSDRWRHLPCAFVQLDESRSCSSKKALASQRESNATRVAKEQGSTDLVFQITDATADGRFPDTKSIRSLPKAPALGGSDEIPEMPKFEANVHSSRHGSNPSPNCW